MTQPYYLIFKTGDAEFRSLKNCHYRQKITPVVELTKGRRSKKDPHGDFFKRLVVIESLFSNQNFVLDVTSDENQSNEQIRELYNSNGGYSNWCELVSELHNKEGFRNLIPTILVNTQDENLDSNLAQQVKVLSREFSTLVYRNPIEDCGYEDDLQVVFSALTPKTKLIVIVDCNCLQTTTLDDAEKNIRHRIQVVKNIAKGFSLTIVVAGTSFPNSVPSVSKDDSGDFPVKELELFERLSDLPDLVYGDYGSVNPIRNDDVVMARGWTPRIDVPTCDSSGRMVIHFEKQKKEKNSDYASAYTKVAKKITCIANFPNELAENWGVEQIFLSASGDAPGANPSFWISVRMSIHVDQILSRLSRKYQ